MTVSAQENLSALIPMPNFIETSSKNATTQLDNSTTICTTLQNDDFLIQELNRIIEKHLQITPIIDNKCKKNVIEINIDTTLQEKERYILEVNKKGVTIKGCTKGALFMALKTFEQILIGDVCNTKSNKIEHIKIDDKPRFAHRAIMIDPARHFLPVKDVKFFIDQMARFKFNVLQIHLTDDQGWRVEIKSHPRLTEIGAYRNNGKTPSPDNGYYTQEEIKEIITYAAERNIEVIPELDIPGHSVAILAAYPELGCKFRQNEKKELGSVHNAPGTHRD
jgi:hexosaminidase